MMHFSRMLFGEHRGTGDKVLVLSLTSIKIHLMIMVGVVSA